jgi:hypothetical protein
MANVKNVIRIQDLTKNRRNASGSAVQTLKSFKKMALVSNAPYSRGEFRKESIRVALHSHVKRERLCS